MRTYAASLAGIALATTVGFGATPAHAASVKVTQDAPCPPGYTEEVALTVNATGHTYRVCFA